MSSPLSSHCTSNKHKTRSTLCDESLSVKLSTVHLIHNIIRHVPRQLVCGPYGLVHYCAGQTIPGTLWSFFVRSVERGRSLSIFIGLADLVVFDLSVLFHPLGDGVGVKLEQTHPLQKVLLCSKLNRLRLLCMCVCGWRVFNCDICSHVRVFWFFLLLLPFFFLVFGFLSLLFISRRH